MRVRFLAVLIPVLLASALPGAALAQGDCDELVVDAARVIDDEAEVRESAGALVRLGAEVRVRTFTSADRNLEAAMRTIEERCPSWRAPDGGRRNNLLAVFVSIEDRQIGTYYGSQWSGLDSQYLRIQSEFMGPRFRDGDFSGGISAGLGEFARVIDARLHPPPEVGIDVLEPEPAEAGGRSAGAGLGLLVLLALVALAAGAVGVSRVASTRRERNRARRQAQERREAASAAFASLDEAWARARESADMAAQVVSDTDRRRLEGLREAAEPLVAAATSAHVAASDAAPDGDAPEAWSALSATFEGALHQIAAARSAVDAVEAAASELHDLSLSLPSSIDAAAAAIEAARRVEQATRTDGYLTHNAAPRIDEAAAVLESARTWLGQKQLTSARDSLRTAADTIERVTTWLHDLPAVRAELTSGVQAATARAGLAPAKIDEARRAFERIAATYAKSSWEAIAGNGSEAEKRLAATRAELSECEQDVQMSAQRWDDARAGLAHVDEWLDDLDALTAAIVELEADLAEAKQAAPRELADARSDLAKAQAFVEQHPGDLSPQTREQLERAADAFARAEAAAAAGLPDYLEVVAAARTANEAADAVLAQARSEHEAAARLRAEEEAAVRDAKAAIARASRFVDAHRRDAGRRAKPLLARARRAWEDVESADDTQARIALAREAQRHADEAYEDARESFRAAERDRRQSGSGGLVGGILIGTAIGGGRTRSSGSGFGSWGSPGGGGSSSFGSSGGGGGGSSSW